MLVQEKAHSEMSEEGMCQLTMQSSRNLAGFSSIHIRISKEMKRCDEKK